MSINYDYYESFEIPRHKSKSNLKKKHKFQSIIKMKSLFTEGAFDEEKSWHSDYHSAQHEVIKRRMRFPQYYISHTIITDTGIVVDPGNLT